MIQEDAVELKAKSLIEEYWKQLYYNAVPVNYNKKTEDGKDNLMIKQAKQCAIICCDEMINEYELLRALSNDFHKICNEYLTHWQKVKTHIINS